MTIFLSIRPILFSLTNLSEHSWKCLVKILSWFSWLSWNKSWQSIQFPHSTSAKQMQPTQGFLLWSASFKKAALILIPICHKKNSGTKLATISWSTKVRILVLNWLDKLKWNHQFSYSWLFGKNRKTLKLAFQIALKYVPQLVWTTVFWVGKKVSNSYFCQIERNILTSFGSGPPFNCTWRIHKTKAPRQKPFSRCCFCIYDHN